MRIMGDTMNNIYTNKLDKLEVAEKFLQKYNLPSLKQEEIGNLNRTITGKKAEEVKANKRKPEKQKTKTNTSQQRKACRLF